MVKKLLFNTFIVIVLFALTSLQTTESLTITQDIQYLEVNKTSTESTVRLDEPFQIVKAHYDSNVAIKEKMLGVLYIPGIALDVVMESSDNQYYLTHDKNGNKNKKGELFTSQRSHNKVDDLSLIYGHNNANGTKFGRLQLSLYSGDSTRTLYYYDGITLKQYQLAFAFDFMDGSRVLERKDLDESQRQTFLKDLEEQSRYVRNPNRTQEYNDILFLQTCLRAFGDERVVFAFEFLGEITG